MTVDNNLSGIEERRHMLGGATTNKENVKKERALLLLRVARLLQGSQFDQERDELLTWSLELLAEEGVSSDEMLQPVDKSEPVKKISLMPLPIFAKYKHRTYRAELLDDWKVRMNGQTYTSPSNAANAITRNQVNGWRNFWRYTNPDTGEEERIDNLRTEY